MELITKGRQCGLNFLVICYTLIDVFWCPGISVGKEKLKFKSDLTSLDDKLRIANKVNNKYLELGWTDVKDYEG